MDFFVKHQLNIMLVLGGICGFIFLFLLCMTLSDKGKKNSFLQIAFFAMILLFSDRLAYVYRGDESTLGYWMVRISNYLVYASILLCENGFNNYLFSLAKKESFRKKDTSLLVMGRCLVVVGIFLLTLSQFLGIYYTFDSTNHYQRAGGFIVCYSFPLILTAIQLVFIVKHNKYFHKIILASLFVFMGLPVVASIIQIFTYGISLTSISIAISAIVLYFLALYDQNKVLTNAVETEIKNAREMREKSYELLHQTAEALASAVDANDKYTHGHSIRVAKYARKIAQLSGMKDEECQDVYLAGLLHDVGKIGIDNDIINNKGKLSDDDFAKVKRHSALGGEILSKIALAPSLSVGARYHHERYDGTGYPEGLKGDDIPKIARIIAVADAYDAMTSNRSYRDMIPQMYVREELVKGMGTQFDPNYAKIMLHLLDKDEEYLMKENRSEEIFGADLVYEFDEYKSKVSAGIRITDCPVSITMQYKEIKDGGMPTLLFYDSADARYYLDDDSLAGEMDFVEFASVGLDGDVATDFVRKMKLNTSKSDISKEMPDKLHRAVVEMVKQEDHLLVKVTTDNRVDEVVLALYDASRYVYLALTGEYCNLVIQDVSVSEIPAEENYVPRIAEKKSYINGPSGDIPNIQVDGWWSACSETFEISDHMNVHFHTMSLPSSRRVWHCPIVVLFTSDDGTINGKNYEEIVSVRLDGEAWSENKEVTNYTSVSKDDSFDNWSIWKQKNKAGVNCRLVISRKEEGLYLLVEDSGLTTVNQTKLAKNIDNIYCYFTGDQCAITDVRIEK